MGLIDADGALPVRPLQQRGPLTPSSNLVSNRVSRRPRRGRVRHRPIGSALRGSCIRHRPISSGLRGGCGIAVRVHVVADVVE